LGVLVSCPKYRGLLTRRYRLLDAMRWVQSLPIAESTELRLTFETLVFRLFRHKLVIVGQASYCDGVISVLLGRETSSTLRAVSAPAMGRPSGSSRPS
jgi:hypothetical protein